MLEMEVCTHSLPRVPLDVLRTNLPQSPQRGLVGTAIDFISSKPATRTLSNHGIRYSFKVKFLLSSLLGSRLEIVQRVHLVMTEHLNVQPTDGALKMPSSLVSSTLMVSDGWMPKARITLTKSSGVNSMSGQEVCDVDVKKRARGMRASLWS